MKKTPISVAVTGAAGAIGYSILFRIASGELFGSDQPLVLNLVDIPEALPALQGVTMELEDCGSPVLRKLTATADLNEGFRDINWALLVGSVSRKPGMERKDLLAINGKIFTGQGQALQKNAARDVRILVVGNPCNTNCLIAMNSAPEIPANRWFAMTRLDENRAKAQLAKKAGADIASVSNLGVWGNHSPTMFPNFFHAKIAGQSGAGGHSGRELAQDGLREHGRPARHLRPPPRNFPNYASGTWGPKEADDLLERDGRRWRNFEK